MTSYLVFPDLASAQARSHTQAVAKGCAGTTQYWWAQVAHPSNGQAALVIEASGAYGPSGLTAPENTALQTLAALTALGWFPGP